LRVAGATVLITGASSGIGAATARAVATANGRPVLVARSAVKLDELVEEVGDSARAYAVDCSNREAVHAVAQRIRREVGTPDVIINNAGSGRWLFFDETEPQEFEQMMGAPFFTAVFTTRAFLPAMIERGSGLIVNINTPIAFVPWQSASGYGAARWALRGLSELLRADLAGTGVKVVQVVPGLVSSGYLAHNPGVEQALPGIVRLIPTQTPEQVASVILRAIERERRLVFTPFMLRLLMTPRHVAPGLLSWIVRQTARKRAPVRSAGSASVEGGGR
jgi:uncharacterized protein